VASEAVTWHPHGNLRRVRIPSRESRDYHARTAVHRLSPRSVQEATGRDGWHRLPRRPPPPTTEFDVIGGSSKGTRRASIETSRPRWTCESATWWKKSSQSTRGI